MMIGKKRHDEPARVRRNAREAHEIRHVGNFSLAERSHGSNDDTEYLDGQRVQLHFRFRGFVKKKRGFKRLNSLTKSPGLTSHVETKQNLKRQQFKCFYKRAERQSP
jgi:hypothetical protein